MKCKIFLWQIYTNYIICANLSSFFYKNSWMLVYSANIQESVVIFISFSLSRWVYQRLDDITWLILFHVWVVARVLAELLSILQLVEESVWYRPECVVFLSAVISCH